MVVIRERGRRDGETERERERERCMCVFYFEHADVRMSRIVRSFDPSHCGRSLVEFAYCRVDVYSYSVVGVHCLT